MLKTYRHLSSGLCYGPSELEGVVSFTDDSPLLGPETKGVRLLRHQITEKRSDGKKPGRL